MSISSAVLGYPPCSPGAVPDVRIRARFESAVETQDLQVRLGGWKETDESARPPWTILQRAKVWQEPKFSALRELLKRPREAAVLTVSAEGDVVSVKVPDNGEGRAGCTVTIYKMAPNIPESVVDMPLRMAIIHVVGRTRSGSPLEVRLCRELVLFIERT